MKGFESELSFSGWFPPPSCSLIEGLLSLIDPEGVEGVDVSRRGACGK